MKPDEMRRCLEALGWSQTELARKLTEQGGTNVPLSTVWRNLHGETPISPALAWALRLAVRAKARGVRL